MPWLSPEEAAERLSVHPATIRRWIKRGQLNASRVGLKYRIQQADVDAMVKPAQGQERKAS